ncbi:hypothetical protein SADUNF_Sadunf13G0001400 [Salix dunnii]|uniref:Uncharacterized protein n=1 Tax=Salix dunnii TaxID=1413687 RepID=A0A835JGG5_9ROSI|nr:hypothetical protein SADUNF_Sadunf13G0001400 [Salix dunnii]
MATETAPSHQTPTSDHESIENKVAEEVKPAEPGTVSLARKPEEKDLKANELASQPTLLDKSEAVEDKKVEPPAVVVQKIDGVPAIDCPVNDKKDLEKDSISDSHTPSVPTLVADVNGEPVAPAIHSVSKEAEEQQLSTSVEKLLQEKPKMVDVPVSLDGAIEKTEEQSKVLPMKESEPIEVKDTEDSAVSKEVDKAESIIPEVEVKLEDQSEVGKQFEEPKTEAPIEQTKEPLEVLPVKSEAVVKDSEDSQLVSKEDDKPESDEQSKVIKVEPKGKPDEVIVETQEPVEALPVEELEAVQVKDIDETQESFKEADKVGTINPEPREVKLESEVTEHMEKTKEQPVEAIEKTQDSSEVHPIKESEAVPLEYIDGLVAVSGVDKPEPVVPQVEVKQEEQSEVTEQIEKTESVVPETEVKLEEQSEVTKLDEKTEEHEVEVKPEGQSVIRELVEQFGVVEQTEKTESVIPETEVKLEEQSEVTKLDEKTEEHEAEVKPEGQSEIIEQAEQIEKTETVIPETEVKLEEQSEVSKLDEKTEKHEVEVKPEGQSEIIEQAEQIEKTETVIPETEVKLEEQSEVTKLDEKTEEHEAEVKPEGQSEIREQAEQSEVTEQIEKTDTVIPETEVKLEEQSEVTKLDEKKDEHEVEVKPEEQSETSEHVEIQSTDEKPEQVAAFTQLAQAVIKEDGGKSSLPEIIHKAGPEAEGTDLVELSLKEIVVEAEKGGEEKEAGKIKAEGEKIASGALKEELAQPIKVEEVSNAASSAKITEKSFEREKIVESVEPALENKKEEVPAKDETQKDGNIEGKLDEATIIVSESVKETQDSMSEVKEDEEEETAKTNEESSEQEKVDEIAKSDTQNLESFVKDAEDAKESQDLPIEVPAKPTQKHSNNILTKVKQSLVKAKKAIIGKSPTPKTVSSDSKGDVKVNN